MDGQKEFQRNFESNRLEPEPEKNKIENDKPIAEVDNTKVQYANNLPPLGVTEDTEYTTPSSQYLFPNNDIEEEN